MAALLLLPLLQGSPRWSACVLSAEPADGKPSREGPVYPILDDDGLLGFIDAKGRKVVEPQFDIVGPESHLDWWINGRLVPAYEGHGVTMSHRFWGFVERVGIVAKDGKYGYITDTGRMLFPPRFQAASAFRDGVAWVQEDGKYSLVNSAGRIVATGFSDVARFHEGWAPVRIGKKWGFLDKDGKITVQPRFDCVGADHTDWIRENVFRGGVAWIWLEDNAGLINRKGDFLADPQFDHVSPFESGLAAVWRNGKLGYLSQDGQLLIPTMYDGGGYNFQEGLAVVKLGQKSGCVNLKNEMVVPAVFDEISGFREGLARVRKGKRFGFIDHRGEMVIDAKFTVAADFRDGLAVVSEDGKKFGVVDYLGRWVATPRYDCIKPYQEGVAVVQLGDRYGAIDRSGNLTVEAKYDTIDPFARGEAIAELRGRCCVIDTQGRWIVEPEYDNIDDVVSDGRRVVRRQWKFGYVDTSGRLIIPLQFDWADRFHDGVALIGMDVQMPLGGMPIDVANWGYIDLAGDWIWRPTD